MTACGGLRIPILVLAASLAAPIAMRADLKEAMAEPNLEKRSARALDNAESALKAARAAYDKGDNAMVAQRAEEMRESVELAGKSLKETGKNPRRSPKWFKRAEISTRNLMQKLDSFQQAMSFADRPLLDKVKETVQDVHDELLLGLVEGKRK